MKKDDYKIKIALKLLKYINLRNYEFKNALRFLDGCDTVLDVGCGRGNFIEKDPSRISGIDLNQSNVNHCIAQGLNVKQGDALNLPYDDNSFDGAHCSHLIQIFDYLGALQLLNELRRVVKPGGIIVLVTFPDYQRTYFTPETLRAYPPHAIRCLLKQPDDFLDPHAAPTYSNAPKLKQEDIWFLRPALIEFEGPRSEFTDGMASMANVIQHAIFLRKYWAYNGYVMKLRNMPK